MTQDGDGPSEFDDLGAITLDEFCERFRVSRRHATNLVASGEVRAIRLGSSVRIPRSELRKLTAGEAITVEADALRQLLSDYRLLVIGATDEEPISPAYAALIAAATGGSRQP